MERWGRHGTASVLTGGPAPRARTLVDVFAATVHRHPHAPAIDDGTSVRSYRQLARDALDVAHRLRAVGVGPGQRVGVRHTAGTAALPTTILGVLAAGAAYVPVDADDPPGRAVAVWEAAGVSVVVDEEGVRPFGPAANRCGTARRAGVPTDPDGRGRRPRPTDDAWVICTSGSTGGPKGVAVTHRSAAAFVDAEAGLFLAGAPLGPEDRVLAGLSVAFDASCEELWLAWRSGACLVPVDRSLVRAGPDLGPFLVERGITVLSTVPTLAGVLDPADLAGLRLLIVGGETCPAELAGRLAAPGRELWNTYGPTEATVVTTAARLDAAAVAAGGPLPIGGPLPGWRVAVVDDRGLPVPWGAPGELVIGGVGLGRYVEATTPADGAVPPGGHSSGFRPAAALGWSRAYFSGDIVEGGPRGLRYRGRADGQVKIAGRRLELGEVDTLARRLASVRAAVSTVQRAPGGAPVLAVYVVPESRPFDTDRARMALMADLPAGVAPVLVTLDGLPVRPSGKVDRRALPWPPPDGRATAPVDDLPTAWLAARWAAVLGPVPFDRDTDFFASGGTSFGAAQLVSSVRTRHPTMSVADVYRFPTLGAMAQRLAELAEHGSAAPPARRTPRWFPTAQLLTVLALFVLTGARWLVVLAAADRLAGSHRWGPDVAWPLIVAGWLVVASPPARVATAAAVSRLALRRLQPGRYRRGGTVHFRLWACERLATACAIDTLAGTSWMARYARALGCTVGRGVVLSSRPPVTGLASFGDGAVVEPGVDCSGWWLEAGTVHVGRVDIGSGASIGARSTLLPDGAVGADAEVDPGTCVAGAVPAGRRWTGSPGGDSGPAGVTWPARPAPASRWWRWCRDAVPVAVAAVPVAASLPALLLLRSLAMGSASLPTDLERALALAPLTALCWSAGYALVVAGSVRLLGRSLPSGDRPLDSAGGVAASLVDDLLAQSRHLLFPLYASLLTPPWLRLLGARVGRRVEASTVSTLPSLLTVDDGGFLADDTLVAPRRLRHGWQRLGPGRVGRRAFVGNSAVVEAGHAVPDDGLVGVLSSLPAGAPRASSWLGLPPIELPRTPHPVDARRTFDPPGRLVAARALVESLRLVPVIVSVALVELVVGLLGDVAARHGLGAALVAGPVLLAAAGTVAWVVTVTAKWVVLGRVRPGEHPLWSGFVWRTELVDAFVEELAVPWLGAPAVGTPLLTAVLRSLGARIGRDVWCETWWLPEADLVTVADGAVVNRGCVLQTHLFHDRLMRLGEVRLGPRSTLGPHCIALPGSSAGDGSTVVANSLVMRGESVPPGTRWLGNPLAAWPSPTAAPTVVAAAAGRDRASDTPA